jgi:hypothetical protein
VGSNSESASSLHSIIALRVKAERVHQTLTNYQADSRLFLIC